jgi:glycosyltransferase involved in cell wall biosynthesis
MRAGHRGWHHVVSDRTLVLHKRGSSFGERRKSLLKRGRAIVDGRFPEYQSLVAPLRTSPTFLTLNYRVRAAASGYSATAKRPKPRILYVISSRTGGTPQTNRDLMQALSDDHDVFLLTCEKTEMHLHRLVDGDMVSVDRHDLKRPVDVKTHRLREYDDVVTAWLIYNAIELVHIRHIAWHSLGLIDAAKDLNLGVVFSFHDYYVACPTVKLLDNNMSYCGGTCTAGDGYCVPALWKLDTVPHLKHSWVNRWRDIMAAALLKCDAFVTTVDSAFAVVAEVFPFITSVPNIVIPHGRDFDTLTLSAAPVRSGEPLRVAVPGNISDAKGASLIAGVKALDRNNRIEFHIFGKHSRTLDGVDVVRHGLYARDDLGSLMRAANIHIGGVFSVWPETYCHTLTELWASGLPVVGFDSGAVGERIAASGAGWLFDDPTPESLFDLLLHVAGSEAERTARIDAVARWQETIGRHHGTARMGDRYRAVYETVRDRMLNFTIEHSAMPAQSSQEFEPAHEILELAQ